MKKKTLAAAVVATIIAGLVIILRGIYTFLGFSDGFTISGFLMLAFSGLLFISKQGVFMAFGYGMKKLFSRDNLARTFYEYKLEKEAENEEIIILPYLIVGVIFILLAIFCAIFATPLEL